MYNSITQDLKKISDALIRHRDPAIFQLTFLRDLSENEERWETYRDSLGGNVVNLHVVNSQNALILFCARAWESGKDFNSIPQAEKLIQKIDDDPKRVQQQLQAHYLPDGILRETADSICQLSAQKIVKVLRVMRSENLAHNISTSRDRVKHFPDGFDNHGISRNDLFAFAEQTIRLIERIELISSGKNYCFNSSSSVCQEYCDAYWRVMPSLRELE